MRNIKLFEELFFLKEYDKLPFKKKEDKDVEKSDNNVDPFDEEDWNESEELDPEQKVQRQIDILCDKLNIDKESKEIENFFNNIMMIVANETMRNINI